MSNYKQINNNSNKIIEKKRNAIKNLCIWLKLIVYSILVFRVGLVVIKIAIIFFQI